jgi:hypothetical protein
MELRIPVSFYLYCVIQLNTWQAPSLAYLRLYVIAIAKVSLPYELKLKTMTDKRDSSYLRNVVLLL